MTSTAYIHIACQLIANDAPAPIGNEPNNYASHAIFKPHPALKHFLLINDTTIDTVSGKLDDCYDAAYRALGREVPPEFGINKDGVIANHRWDGGAWAPVPRPSDAVFGYAFPIWELIDNTKVPITNQIAIQDGGTRKSLTMYYFLFIQS